jgi:hypothetical protein
VNNYSVKTEEVVKRWQREGRDDKKEEITG